MGLVGTKFGAPELKKAYRNDLRIFHQDRTTVGLPDGAERDTVIAHSRIMLNLVIDRQKEMSDGL
jgi:hypothetical protein